MTVNDVFIDEDGLELDSGKKLSKLELAYQTFGTLNKKSNNVVLICHPLTGDSNAMEWWPKIVGPDLAINTDEYYVICINVLGGCMGSSGPGSINPETNIAYGMDFPVITISDMVNAQHKLIKHLGISKIKMVIGGSMGGMQALDWVAKYPEIIESCVPIAACLKVSPLAIAFDSVGRRAIMDQLESGKGPSGLVVARQLGHITYLSEDAMEQKFSRRLQDAETYQYTLNPEFEIESYLNHQGEKFVQRFNLYSYLILTKAVSYFDMLRSYGTVSDAFSASNAKFLVLAISSDWLYTTRQSKDLAYQLMKLNKHVSYVEINSDYGHDTFLIDSEETKIVIKSFLESL